MSQLISGQAKSASTGIVRDLDPQNFGGESRASVAGMFVRSKMSPSASLILDILKGETMMGEELSAKKICFRQNHPIIPSRHC